MLNIYTYIFNIETLKSSVKLVYATHVKEAVNRQTKSVWFIFCFYTNRLSRLETTLMSQTLNASGIKTGRWLNGKKRQTFLKEKAVLESDWTRPSSSPNKERKYTNTVVLNSSQSRLSCFYTRCI